MRLSVSKLWMTKSKRFATSNQAENHLSRKPNRISKISWFWRMNWIILLHSNSHKIWNAGSIFLYALCCIVSRFSYWIFFYFVQKFNLINGICFVLWIFFWCTIIFMKHNLNSFSYPILHLNFISMFFLIF